MSGPMQSFLDVYDLMCLIFGKKSIPPSLKYIFFERNDNLNTGGIRFFSKFEDIFWSLGL